MDNASFHRKSRIEKIATRYGLNVIWLPVYSPDFNPIDLSAEKSAPHLQQCVNRIQAVRGEMRFGKRIMLMIHMCSMLERLIFEQPNKTPPKTAAADMMDACEPLETLYSVLISYDEYQTLEQIIALDLT